MMTKDLNIEDIARLSGYSRSTVSRVLNNQAYVSEKARRKVLEVIQENDYQPNLVARALVSQRSNVIGILIPHTVNELFTDPFFSTLLRQITSTANQLGYGVTLWLASSESSQDNFYARGFTNSMIDGLVIASATINPEFLAWLAKFPKPYVFVGTPPPLNKDISYVEVQNTDGAYMLTRHLIEQGYRRIGFIEGVEGQISSDDRKRGYLNALEAAGIAVDPSIIIPHGNYKELGGYEAMKCLLQENIEAVFAASDMMAIGAMRAIRDAGLRVPDDIAVAGFDDIPYASVFTPSLTTVRQPISQLGDEVAKVLVNLLDGTVEGSSQVILPVELIVRDSTVKSVT
jgi:LacI family transcriptional regulator